MNIKVRTITPTEMLFNDWGIPLNGLYSVAIGFIGRDEKNGGFTVGPVRIFNEIPVLEAQAILVEFSDITEKNLNSPVVIFLNDWNDSNYRLHSIFALKPFHLMYSKPLLSAPRFPLAVLDSHQNNVILGSRDPKPFTGTPSFLEPNHFNKSIIYDYAHYRTRIEMTRGQLAVTRDIIIS